MNRRWVGMVAALGLWAEGCDSGTGAAAPAVGAPETKLAAPAKLDSGGHPLVLPSDDSHTLGFEAELLRLVNVHRASRGMAPLVEDPEVRDVARGHSRHMIVHDFFGHTSPEGLTPADRMEEAGVAWSGVGENLAAGYGSPQAVFDAWMMSPEHRKNIESEVWTHTGVGYQIDAQPANSGSPLHYWTQNFLRP